MGLFDDLLFVNFTDAHSHALFRRLHPAGDRWYRAGEIICVLLDFDDTVAHSLALRCGATIAPGSRIRP